MKLIASKIDIQKYVQISNKRNNAIIEQYMRDAQFIDLQNLMCEEFFTMLVNNPDDFKKLIKGGTYDYNGITYINQGLEVVYAHFVNARYRKFGGEVDTPFGSVTKTDPNSFQNTENMKQRMYTFERQNAMTYWESSVLKFLKRTNYKNYNDICKCNQNKSKMNGFRINIIG